jgi:hypothetical protein
VVAERASIRITTTDRDSAPLRNPESKETFAGPDRCERAGRKSIKRHQDQMEMGELRNAMH